MHMLRQEKQTGERENNSNSSQSFNVFAIFQYDYHIRIHLMSLYQFNCFCDYRALRVLNDMDQAQVIPTVVTFNTLIESCARNGKAQRAREVLELMKKRGLNPDERSFSAVVQV